MCEKTTPAKHSPGDFLEEIINFYLFLRIIIIKLLLAAGSDGLRCSRNVIKIANYSSKEGQTKWWDWPATHTNTHKSHRMFAGAAGCDPEIHISIVSCACLPNCMQNDMMSLISSTPKILKMKFICFGFLCWKQGDAGSPERTSPTYPSGSRSLDLHRQVGFTYMVVFNEKWGRKRGRFWTHTHTRTQTQAHTDTQTLNIKGTEGYCISRSGF